MRQKDSFGSSCGVLLVCDCGWGKKHLKPVGSMYGILGGGNSNKFLIFNPVWGR